MHLAIFVFKLDLRVHCRDSTTLKSLRVLMHKPFPCIFSVLNQTRVYVKFVHPYGVTIITCERVTRLDWVKPKFNRGSLGLNGVTWDYQICCGLVRV